jgi:hypothetical protein
MSAYIVNNPLLHHLHLLQCPFLLDNHANVGAANAYAYVVNNTSVVDCTIPILIIDEHHRLLQPNGLCLGVFHSTNVVQAPIQPQRTHVKASSHSHSTELATLHLDCVCELNSLTLPCD